MTSYTHAVTSSVAILTVRAVNPERSFFVTRLSSVPSDIAILVPVNYTCTNDFLSLHCNNVLRSHHLVLPTVLTTVRVNFS